MKAITDAAVVARHGQTALRTATLLHSSDRRARGNEDKNEADRARIALLEVAVADLERRVAALGG